MRLTPTPEEEKIIARCMAVLTTEEVDAAEKEAADLAGFLLNQPRASEDLTRTLVWIILRNAGGQVRLV
jgi:hypothetical protein